MGNVIFHRIIKAQTVIVIIHPRVVNNVGTAMSPLRYIKTLCEWNYLHFDVTESAITFCPTQTVKLVSGTIMRFILRL